MTSEITTGYQRGGDPADAHPGLAGVSTPRGQIPRTTDSSDTHTLQNVQRQDSDSSDMHTFVSKSSSDIVLLLSYLLHSILARLVAKALVAHLSNSGLSQECTKKTIKRRTGGSHMPWAR